MTIRLTEEQWANVVQGGKVPVRVSDPAEIALFVLVRSDVYERFKSLFEEDLVTEQDRRFQLEQFGKRAGWNDPEMDVYDDLRPEYDPSELKGGVRGKYLDAYRKGTNLALLAPEVRAAFPTDDAVNEALRSLMRGTSSTR